MGGDRDGAEALKQGDPADQHAEIAPVIDEGAGGFARAERTGDQARRSHAGRQHEQILAANLAQWADDAAILRENMRIRIGGENRRRGA